MSTLYLDQAVYQSICMVCSKGPRRNSRNPYTIARRFIRGQSTFIGKRCNLEQRIIYAGATQIIESWAKYEKEMTELYPIKKRTVHFYDDILADVLFCNDHNEKVWVSLITKGEYTRFLSKIIPPYRLQDRIVFFSLRERKPYTYKYTHNIGACPLGIDCSGY